MFRHNKKIALPITLLLFTITTTTFAETEKPAGSRSHTSSEAPATRPSVEGNESTLNAAAVEAKAQYDREAGIFRKDIDNFTKGIVNLDDFLKKTPGLEDALKDPNAKINSIVLNGVFDENPDLRGELAAKYMAQKNPGEMIGKISELTKPDAKSATDKFTQTLKSEAENFYKENKALVDAMTKRNGENPLVVATRLQYLESLKNDPSPASQKKLGEEMARMMVSMGDKQGLHSSLIGPDSSFANHPLRNHLQTATTFAISYDYSKGNDARSRLLLSAFDRNSAKQNSQTSDFRTSLFSAWDSHQPYIQEFHKTLAAAKSGDQEAINNLRNNYPNYTVNWAGSALHKDTNALWLAGGGSFNSEGKPTGKFTHIVLGNKYKVSHTITLSAYKADRLNAYFLEPKDKDYLGFNQTASLLADKAWENKIETLKNTFKNSLNDSNNSQSQITATVSTFLSGYTKPAKKVTNLVTPSSPPVPLPKDLSELSDLKLQEAYKTLSNKSEVSSPARINLLNSVIKERSRRKNDY